MEIRVLPLDNNYSVSENGDVLRHNGYGASLKILKPVKNNAGYFQVPIAGKKMLVHRLVATAFIENPLGLKVVNHLNSISTDNRVSNLEWATYSQNSMHGVAYGNMRSGASCRMASISEEQAKEVIKLGNSGLPVTRISQTLDISYSIVHKILKGQAWNQVSGLPRVRFYKLKKVA